MRFLYGPRFGRGHTSPKSRRFFRGALGWIGDKLFALIALSSFMAKLICHRCLELERASPQGDSIEKCSSDNCQKCRNNHRTFYPPFYQTAHCAARNGSGSRQIGIRTHLSALDFQLHVILARCLPILAFLPAVSIASITHLLPGVQQQRSALGSKVG